MEFVDQLIMALLELFPPAEAISLLNLRDFEQLKSSV